MKTIADLVQEYLNHLHALRYTTSPRRAREYLRRFREWLQSHHGIRTINQLTCEHLRKWYQHTTSRCTRAGRPLSARSINYNLTYIRSWLSFLAKRSYISVRLTELLPAVKEPRRLPGSVLTHAQTRKLLSGIPTDNAEGYRNRAMLEVLYSSGIRISELLGLTLDDVDLTNRVLKVMGKGQKERIVPVGRTATKYLEIYIVAVRPYLTTTSSQRFVFLNSKGNPMQYRCFCDHMRKIREDAKVGVHVTAHTFRRSCTTELIKDGANIYHVKELLGHESLDTLKPYVRLTINDLKKTHAKCHPRERDNL